jgi:hypothetical protein
MTRRQPRNTYPIRVLKGFFDRLAATPDGNSSLLDHSLIRYDSSTSDATEHNVDPIPIRVIYHLSTGLYNKGCLQVHGNPTAKRALTPCKQRFV